MRTIARVIAVLGLLVTAQVQADLVGDTVGVFEVSIDPPNPLEVIAGGQVLVEAGVVEIDNGIVAIDIEESSILIQFDGERDLSGSAGFEFFGFVFNSLDWPNGDIGGVSVVTNVPGFDPLRVAWGPSQVDVDLKGIVYQSGDFVAIDLLHIPLPPAAFLLGSGLLGIAVRTRRTR